MTRVTLSGRTARVALAVSAALLIAYALIWTRLSAADIGRSDFTAFYVGATLLRQGHAASLYDESLQTPLHARLIEPDHEGNLPFVDPPMAAALVLPVTLLDLDSAYRVWALVEVTVLAGAVLIAGRAASRSAPQRPSRLTRTALFGVALGGIGTLFAMTQAQWTPVLALGLAVAYECWQRNRGSPGRRDAAVGAAALLLGAAVGKPQLALGLIAFLLGWRRRGLLLGSVTAVTGAAAISLLLAGPGGIAGFVHIVIGSAARWDPHLMIGATGFAAGFAGRGVPAAIVAVLITLVACAGAFVLGRRVRREPSTLPAGLAGAAALSLLAAPHAYLADVALLAPASAWILAAAASQASSVTGHRTSRPAGLAPLLALWAALSIAAAIDLTTGGQWHSGPMTPYVLAAAGAAALFATASARRRHLRYRGADETALGALADGVHRG